jgi:hypothetical protein
MQSISGNDQLVADVFVILCAPSCLGAHKMMNAVFFFFSDGFPGVRGADTLHVVGSYHDPTTCKVSLPNMRF